MWSLIVEPVCLQAHGETWTTCSSKSQSVSVEEGTSILCVRDHLFYRHSSRIRAASCVGHPGPESRSHEAWCCAGMYLCRFTAVSSLGGNFRLFKKIFIALSIDIMVTVRMRKL